MAVNWSDPQDVLARTIWGEARGGGVPGMTAVAAVVLNRVADPGWWGDDILSVCAAREQFSCWNEDDPNRAKALAVTDADPQFAEALSIAAMAVDGTLIDPTHGADSYYALGTTVPAWATSDDYRCTIGTQAFYRVGV